MFCTNVAARNKSVFTILCFSLGLFASSAAVSQEVEIEVVGGNSSNSRMFGLNYGVDDAGNLVNKAIELNTDANQYPSLNSFTFVRNTCGEQRTDVVAASTNASRLVIYAGGKGDGTPICGGGAEQDPCPPRPVGLSTSTEQVISVATSGGSRFTPGVFTFTAGDAGDASACGSFERLGGDLSVTLSNGANAGKLTAIADTEFMREDVDDVKAGDLLVLVSNPAMIVHVAAGDISEDAASGKEFAGSALAFSSFRRATPTGLAIVPGETPNILVTLSTGAIANFYWTGSVWSWKSFETGGLFPNPRGIGAGAREGVPYIVVSEQNRGRYIRQELDWEDDGSLKRSGEPGAFREIQSPVGAPEGVAVSQEDPNVFIAGECFNPVSGEPIGCDVGPASFHFSQGFEDGLKGARIRFEVQLIPDPSNNLKRDENGLLQLTDYKQDFFVPPTCRGFKVNDYDDEQLVLIDLELLGGLKVTAGNFAQVTGRLKEDLGARESCAARVFYHPTKDSALDPLPECKNSEGAPETCTEGSERFAYTLFDTTVSCQSPSRGIITARSPVVLCENPNYDDRVANPTGEVGRNEFVNPTIRIFLDDLKLAVAELGTEFPELKNKLNSLVTGLTNPSMGAPVPAYYLETSRKADEGAVEVFNLKKDGAFAESGLPSDLYARLLTGFLGLAFFTMEHGALIPYGPPDEFCDPYIEYPGPDGTILFLYPELQDVKCATEVSEASGT